MISVVVRQTRVLLFSRGLDNSFGKQYFDKQYEVALSVIAPTFQHVLSLFFLFSLFISYIDFLF